MTNLLHRLTFDRLATAMFFVLVATVACLMPIQTDTWWQLRGGQQFWQTGIGAAAVETYSHTANGPLLDEPRVAEPRPLLCGLRRRAGCPC